MTIPIHYVPVLIWKRAERNALANLTDDQKNTITPLIQLVMPKPILDRDKKKKKSMEDLFEDLILQFKNKRIPQIPDEIKTCWGQKQIYIDFSLLYTVALKEECVKRVFELSSIFNLNLIPVLNLSDS